MTLSKEQVQEYINARINDLERRALLAMLDKKTVTLPDGSVDYAATIAELQKPDVAQSTVDGK